MKKFVFSAVVVLGIIGALNVFRGHLGKTRTEVYPKPMPLAEYYRKYNEVWEKHLQRDPFSASAVKNLAAGKISLARATGDESLYQEAEVMLKSSANIMPKGDSTYPLLLSRTMMATHQFAAARELLEHALETAPDSVALHQSRADALQGYGDYDAAIQEIEWVNNHKRAFASEVRLAQLLDVVGRDKEGFERLLKAKDEFRIEDPEASAWIRLMVGIYYLKRGELNTAQKYFYESLDKAPDYYLAKEHLAETFETQGKFAEAKPLLEAAIQVKHDPGLLMRLSKVERHLKNVERADALHAEAMQMFKANAERNAAAHGRDYAKALLDEGGDANVALTYLEKEYAARPGDILSDLARARCLRILGREEEAQQYMDKALRYPDADADVYVEAALLADARGEKSRAESFRQQAKAKNPYSVS